MMDEQEILKRIEAWTKLVRRYMRHDEDCAIWRDVSFRHCDCGLDAALRKSTDRPAVIQ